MAGEYFEIRKADNGQYYWRLRDRNHEGIGWSGETYVNKSHAVRMVEQVRALPMTTPIKDEIGEP